MIRGTPEYEARWIKRAAEYRAALEEKNTIVAHPVSIRRALVVRWKGHMGTSVTYRDIFWFDTGDIEYVRKHIGGVESMVRLWVVLTHEGFIKERWERLVMAQAHRDGLMYLHAKYLMTEESDQWMKELGGGIQPRRR